MSESVRGGNAVTDRETRLAKEYQALKERNALVEAQLEAMRWVPPKRCSVPRAGFESS